MIDIYDSTLRDGGYINNWKFTQDKVQGIYDAANSSGIEYVEIGYLDKVNHDLLNKSNAKVMVMVDYNKRDKYDIPNKEETKIDGIRVSSHKPEINDCIDYTQSLKDRGYLVSIQMMAISNYSEVELLQLVDKFNEIDIISLADSNGSLMERDIIDLSDIFHDRRYNLNLHAHNNLQLAFSNSISAINEGFDIIDCSFNGIGRGAGNLPTELLMAYLNKYEGYDFNLGPVLNAISKYILPLRGAYKWGYNIPNMFSGIEKIHPYYGRDVNKYNLDDAQKILDKIGKQRPIKYYGNQKTICFIPSRYESSRFLGKPLKIINGKELLWWVYNNAIKSKSFDDVIVITDDDRIETYCDDNNLKVIRQLTDTCKCGTDAIAEVTEIIDSDLYVNLQGDEPLIMPETIREFIDGIKGLGEINRMAFNAMTDCDSDDLNNINIPKVVTNIYGDLLYISRLPIPFIKSNHIPKHYKELGLHAYNKKSLESFKFYEQFEAEKSENIEFLRFLEMGKYVRMIYLELPFKNHAVDIPEDIDVVEEIMKKYNI